jgi:hypothetical protein
LGAGFDLKRIGLRAVRGTGKSVDQRMRLECGVGFRQKATSTGTDDCIMKLLVR